MKNNMKRPYLHLALTLIIFIASLIATSTKWVLSTFDNLSMDQIIFHLKVPLKGSNNDFLADFLYGPFKIAVFVALAMALAAWIFALVLRCLHYEGKTYYRLLTVASIVAFSVTTHKSVHALDLITYYHNIKSDSHFFESHYIPYDETRITPPQKDRNLIYIFLESFESSFTSKVRGGALDVDLLEPLAALSDANTQFSHTTQMGGAQGMSGTGWTVAAMVAQTSGVPLKLPIHGNAYGDYSTFLPGVTSIGDILQGRGYNQVLLIGSDASFGGRDSYFRDHGNYEIKDYNYALENAWIPADYHQWWGYEDEKLFAFAKAELGRLSKQKEPFNLTMLTADTHNVGGYVTEGMETPFDEQYKNVVFHSAKQVRDFVAWIQTQPFARNTTIVISGDHNTMDADFIGKNVAPDFNRTTYNLFINGVVNTENSKERAFAAIDMFPTTLSSLGYKIKGDRLGIGTNLFATTPTLFEEVGIDATNSELDKKSIFYDNAIVFE